MALSLTQTAALALLLKPGMRVASMGYPDLIAPREMILPLLGDQAVNLLYREDSAAICKRHGIREGCQIPDAESFFFRMGCKLDVYDIVQERGCEILCDLNKPIYLPHVPVYDIVLDVGTAEHCFNIAQAMMNMAALVKVGGYIIHENPFNCSNHGFYNLNPTFYVDFYKANGFEVIECCLATRDGRTANVPHGKRFKFLTEEANAFCIAQRLRVQAFVHPVQAKYAATIPAAGVPGDSTPEKRAIGERNA